MALAGWEGSAALAGRGGLATFLWERSWEGGSVEGRVLRSAEGWEFGARKKDGVVGSHWDGCVHEDRKIELEAEELKELIKMASVLANNRQVLFIHCVY